MPRSFNLALPSLAGWKEPRVFVRVGLGILLIGNLVAAMFAFHVIGASPEGIGNQLASARLQLLASQARLSRSKTLAGRIEKGSAEGQTFLANYFTTRRHTYSTIIGEITETAKQAGMTMKEATIAPLDAIEGSNDMDMMTISVNFEGGYPQLIKFVNLLDRSPRFLILEGLQLAAQPKGDILTVNIKLNTFIREDISDEPAPAPKAVRSGM